MGIFKTIWAVATVNSEFNRYNKNIPAFDALRAAGDDEGERALILEKSQDFAQAISSKLGISYEFYGLENIPEDGAFLLVANHQSFADVLAIYYVMDKYPIGFIAKSEFRSWKSLAKCIAYTRSIFIERGNGRQAVQILKDAADLFKRGYRLAIFPEGHRSKGHDMKEFKPGSLKFAQKGKVPILPVSIDGGYKVFEIDNNFHTPTRMKLKFHPLVHIEEMSRSEQTEAFKQVEQTIRDGLEDLV